MAAFDSSISSLSAGPLPGTAQQRTLAFSDPNFARNLQRSAVESSRGLEDSLEGLRRKNFADIADTGQERERLRTGISSTIASRFGRAQGGTQQSQLSGNLQQLLRKTKARAGISRRGEKAIANQQLSSRLKAVRSNLNRRGTSLQLAGAGQRIRSGLDANLQASRDKGNAAVAGAAGGVVGGLAASFSGGPEESPFEVPESVDQGTARSDFLIQNPRRNSFDFDAPQGVAFA